jgi:KipI family sensor histidine kinase inhibitor
VSRIPAEFFDAADGVAVVEFPGASDQDANRAAVGLAAALTAAPLSGLFDAVPGARTLFLTFDPFALPREVLRREALARGGEATAPASAREVAIETLYGGSAGADLAEISAAAGMEAAEFARRHAAGDYSVAFLGFAPGFAYLAGLDPALSAARLASPRPRVPAGSVAIGGPYTGVYPSATPGGWRLIGRSAIRLFDEQSDTPALLRAGDRVRFVPTGEARFLELERELAEAASRIPTFPVGRPVLRVIKPGVFTSVQGAARFGRGGEGLPPGGAADAPSLERGNRRLGNPSGAAALEMTLLGPELEALTEGAVCVAGAPMSVEWNGRSASADAPIRLASGDRLRFGPARDGARAYLCVEGGLEPTGRLGLTRRLEAGELLMRRSGADAGRPAAREDSPEPATKSGETVLRLRVVLDPRRGRYFEPAAVERFLDTAFRVSSTSDRRGTRLEGDPVAASGGSEMPPEGTALGTIQVPAGGQPILLGPDRPITGGYARLGTVIAADWPRVAQASPGRAVRFTAVTLGEALAARPRETRVE